MTKDLRKSKQSNAGFTNFLNIIKFGNLTFHSGKNGNSDTQTIPAETVIDKNFDMTCLTHPHKKRQTINYLFAKQWQTKNGEKNPWMYREMRMAKSPPSCLTKYCVQGITDFKSALLFSIETQVTLGYGQKYIGNDCDKVIFVLALQAILSFIFDALFFSMIFIKISSCDQRLKSVKFSKYATFTLINEKPRFSFRVIDERDRCGSSFSNFKREKFMIKNELIKCSLSVKVVKKMLGNKRNKPIWFDDHSLEEVLANSSSGSKNFSLDGT